MKRVIGFLIPVLLLLLSGCVRQERQAGSWDALKPMGSTPLSYAEQFSIDSFEGGYQKISIGADGVYFVVPEGAEVPEGIPSDVTVIKQPLKSIYLVATSAMDLFRQLDGIGSVTLSGTDADGWYIDEARKAMEAGTMAYAGKYSAPDYERILAAGCDLAIESTMIYHTPEVKEQLESLGIPVLVERSSYEGHPLGRMEWIKLYAALLGKQAEAEQFFDALVERLAPVLEQESTGKTVTFFYINSNGAVNVRMPDDYIAKSIGLAGGIYCFSELDSGSALSTANLQMEVFYEQARDADVLIYNSAIEGELSTLDQFLEKDVLLSEFKAVREGNVWCTGKNLFQESLGLGELILDIHGILTEEDPETTYLHRLD